MEKDNTTLEQLFKDYISNLPDKSKRILSGFSVFLKQRGKTYSQEAKDLVYKYNVKMGNISSLKTGGFASGWLPVPHLTDHITLVQATPSGSDPRSGNVRIVALNDDGSYGAVSMNTVRELNLFFDKENNVYISA